VNEQTQDADHPAFMDGLRLASSPKNRGSLRIGFKTGSFSNQWRSLLPSQTERRNHFMASLILLTERYAEPIQ